MQLASRRLGRYTGVFKRCGRPGGASIRPGRDLLNYEQRRDSVAHHMRRDKREILTYINKLFACWVTRRDAVEIVSYRYKMSEVNADRYVMQSDYGKKQKR